MIRRSLDEIRQRAVHELMTNDTISIYTMIDDYEWRQSSPYAVLCISVDSTIDALASIALDIADFSRTLDLTLGGGA